MIRAQILCVLSDEEPLTILKERPVRSCCCLLGEIWSFSPMEESVKIVCTAGGDGQVSFKA